MTNGRDEAYKKIVVALTAVGDTETLEYLEQGGTFEEPFDPDDDFLLFDRAGDCKLCGR